MTLNKYKFGDLIELNIIKNESCLYGEEDAIGVNIDKVILPMRGSNDSKNYDKFNLVPPKHFAYNPRGSRKLGLGFNDTEKTYIITFNDNVFRIKDSAQNIVLDIYLFMYLSRKEWDRRAEYISWGSSTEVFDWNIFCDEEIELPNLSIQRKYVDIYKAMVANQQSYERGLEDLKLTFDALIDKVKHTAPKRPTRKLLIEVDERNEDGAVTSVQGINISKQFMPSIADITGVNLKKYKLVHKGQFAFSDMQTGRDECIRIALYNEDIPTIISPAYTVFETKDESVIPEYIMIWFSRAETDRRGWFMSDSSIRTNLDLDRFYEIEVPIPDEKMQQAIVDIYTVYTLRRNTNEQLKKQIKDICPILIRGSLEDGGEPNGEPA